MPKVLIIGAGPCGLGAAWRLKELGFDDFQIIEGSDRPGGLAASFIDEHGFTWDVGGHVQFSHYLDFDRVMDLALPGGWLHHQRESWIWIQNTFVPYPFQNNLWRLSTETQQLCLSGLELARKQKHLPAKNFGQWIDQSFGSGIADLFMRPYNFKVWAFPPEDLSYQWIGERVATVDLARVKENIKLKRDDISWGPNSTFRFPKTGGTGAIWRAVAKLIDEKKISYKTNVISIDSQKKTLKLSGGETQTYDVLLSSIPLDVLFSKLNLNLKGPLLSSHSHIVGIGLRGKIPDSLKTKCWMYFPESSLPFYRVTVFSNYSPSNVPDPESTWSLMCETSSSLKKPLSSENIVEETLRGLRAVGFVSESDQVISKWSMTASPGYPTPSLNRDEILTDAFQQLKALDIYSRGRFGTWKYEVSNQDHTFMQGFEWVDWYLNNREELTVFYPSQANATGKRDLRTRP